MFWKHCRVRARGSGSRQGGSNHRREGSAGGRRGRSSGTVACHRCGKLDFVSFRPPSELPAPRFSEINCLNLGRDIRGSQSPEMHLTGKVSEPIRIDYERSTIKHRRRFKCIYSLNGSQKTQVTNKCQSTGYLREKQVLNMYQKLPKDNDRFGKIGILKRSLFFRAQW